MLLKRFSLLCFTGFQSEAIQHETFNCNGCLVDVTYTVPLNFGKAYCFLPITGGKQLSCLCNDDDRHLYIYPNAVII